MTGSGFASAVDNPPLHALANGTSRNGVYALRRLERVPERQLQRRATTAVDVLFAAGPGARARRRA